MCGAIVLAFVVSNSGYFLPIGGASPGPRFLMPALPFAAVLVAFAPLVFRPFAELMIALSVALTSIATATMPNALEGFKDPLFELWLPRFLSRNLAETTAWLRWGLHGAQPLFILGLGAALAAGSLYATTRPTAASRRVAGIGTGLLTAFVLCFGVPVGIAPDWRRGPGPADSGAEIAILDVGATRLPSKEGRRGMAPWAQLENRGGDGADETLVVFSIYDVPSGKRIWRAWHGHVRWQPGERKRLAIEWSGTDVAPGEYRVGVAVTTAMPGVDVDRQRVLASVEDAARVRIVP